MLKLVPRLSWRWPRGWVGRSILLALLLCATAVLAYTALEFYPQPFFPNSVEAGGIRLYSTGPIPQNAQRRLLEIQGIISRSTLYEPDSPLTLFLCDDEWFFTFITSGSTGSGGGNVLTQRVFFNTRKVIDEGAQLNDAFTRVASRQIVHVLIARRYGPQTYFTTPRWVREGYSEIITRRSAYPDTWEPILRAGADEGSSAFRYFKHGRMVEYMMDAEKMPIGQLVTQPPDQAGVEERMRRWLWNRSEFE